MADPATLTQYLAEAETALHKLLVGEKVQTVSYNGQSVQYTQANLGDLRAYIQSLKAQLGQVSSARARPRGIAVI